MLENIDRCAHILVQVMLKGFADSFRLIFFTLGGFAQVVHRTGFAQQPKFVCTSEAFPSEPRMAIEFGNRNGTC